MPLYEYECPIHKTIEIQQSMSDKAIEECPLCLSENDTHTAIKKLISLCSFQLLGSRWAKDNYS